MEDANKYNKIMSRLQDDFNYVKSLGYKVLGVFLQGSQNYNLDYEGSDIDTKCIILPSFEDFVLNKSPVSTTLIRQDNSHIDLKDIRAMFECFRKQNINFLEIIFTKYFIVDSTYQQLWEEMTSHKEDIAHYNNYASVNCIAGMVFEKNAALCHPYPSIKEKIDKYGYDNKQLHHILRCEEFLNRWIEGVPYEDCLIPTNPSYLVDIKANYIYNVDEAKKLAAESVERVKIVKQRYMDTHPIVVNNEIKSLMDKVLVEVLKTSFLEDING